MAIQPYNSIDVPEPFKLFLIKRGLADDQQLFRFLFPHLNDLPHPEKMANLPEAANLVADYVIKQKAILIWGDYDVDGTTGTALLVNFLREFGAQVSWHIPNRFSEGYGLNIDWFRQGEGAKFPRDFLLITVDCGISNKDQIALLKSFGATVIVTDHHRPPEDGLPDCLILNPSLPSCGFFGEQLAGAGVAFYLAAGIRKRLLPRFPGKNLQLKDYLAFVALGTIADVVELSKTNRILVRAGMEALRATNFPGLRELLISSGLGEGEVLSEDISYLLGPKINAAGRLGDSDIAVTLLTERNPQAAKKLANRLSTLNEQRKSVSGEIFEKIIARLSTAAIEQDRCIIIEEISHQGVAGIIASKLVELFHVPTLIFAKKSDSANVIDYVGSARSPDGVDILMLLRGCKSFLKRCGGHEKAAGLTIESRDFLPFSKRFKQLAQEAWANRRARRPRTADIECSVESMLSEKYLAFFKNLEPFGPGNEAPVFRERQSCIIDAKTVGREMEHLQVNIRGKIGNFKGIGFGLGSRVDEIQKTPIRPMLYCPTINRYRGAISWQIRIIEI